MNDKYKVVIVEDQQMAKQLFELLIESNERFEIVNTFESAALVDVYCMRNDADVIVMDVLTKNGANGLEASAVVKKKYPNIKIVIVTSMPEVSWIEKAKSIGVDSFWYKNSTEMSIVEVLEKTMNGEHVYPDSTPSIEFGLAKTEEFTPRELEVLREMTGGYTNGEIAEHLFVSVNSIKTHIQSLLDKTGFKNRTELAVKAREVGIVILDNED